MIQLAVLLALGPQASAMFPFVIPWDDAVAGTVTDVSFLNSSPAGRNGRIVVRDGHFVEEGTGRRIRFFGTNITARSAFPTHADAEKVAARLAKLGVNIVRFHHLQNDWDVSGGTIWNEARMHREVDPKQLDKLDYFVAALKKRGIYTNLNLQTTRKYFPDMGFPESVLQIPTDFGKKIDKVDRRMIELQKEYARTLLAHTNPYTGLAYKDEPALAVVEINNENSLVGWPGEAPGAGLGQMPEPFRGEIVAAWNRWIHERYSSKQALSQAWLSGVTPDGPTLIDSSVAWAHENQGRGDVRITQFGEELSEPEPSARILDVTVNSNPGPDWYVQETLPGLDLQEGGSYTVSFDARSSAPSRIRISATLDENDWHNLGLDSSFDVGKETQHYRFGFVAGGTRPKHSRISFAIGNMRGTLRVSNLRLKPGLGGIDVTKGYDERKIDLPEGGTRRQMEDYAEFLADTETAYSTEMREFLRKDLGFKANLIDTQISWGGLTSLKREAGSDFADNHAYFQHPAFAKSWDAIEWTIPNTPMVAEFKEGRYGELGGLAQYRVAGKPYTVSEYNHPAPNDYRAEMLPEVMTFAALQDWDIVYTFDYGLTGAEQSGNQAIQGFFAVATDPAKAAFFPSSALLFRAGEVPTLTSTAVLSVPATKPWSPDFTAWAAWAKAGLPNLWESRVAIEARGDVLRRSTTSLAKQAQVSVTASQVPKPSYRVDSAAAKVVVGYVGGRTVAFDHATFAFAPFGNDFASVTAVSRDREPLGRSKRVLITLVGKVENQGMVWKDATRTSVGNKWGHGPTMVEGIPCQVRLQTIGPRKVWALDGNGRRARKVPANYSGGQLTFSVGPEYQTLWYEVAP